MTKAKPTPRQQAILETVWQDDLATLTDAVVRISRLFERLMDLVEAEAREEKLRQEVTT